LPLRRAALRATAARLRKQESRRKGAVTLCPVWARALRALDRTRKHRRKPHRGRARLASALSRSVLWPASAGHPVRLQAHTSREVEVLSRQTLSGLKANGNCVAARRGGEQPTAVSQSVGDERDSAGCTRRACWVQGEVRHGRARACVGLRGSVRKPRRGDIRWLATEWPRAMCG
jgi:hypothetical protein